jgi:hypothetical protein
MKSKKLYICGRVSGDENYQQKFNNAEVELRAAGYTDIVNPTRMCTPETDWRSAMKIVLKAMLDCDGLALLPDWENSRGACLECDLADDLSIPNKPLEDWINGKA